MTDRYFSLYNSVNRLVNEYNTHGQLYVAFDYDNTIYDYHKVGDTYPQMIKLLQYLSRFPDQFKLILFTGNEGRRLAQIEKDCAELDIQVQYVNCSPVMNTTKPYYNILLDDRAGLNEAYQILTLVLSALNYNINN